MNLNVERMVEKETYDQMVKQASPNSKIGTNILKAFFVGGIICVIGELFSKGYEMLPFNFNKEEISMATSITMVFLGAFLTALGVYSKIGKFAGAGSIIPITGFSNSVASPSMEFNSEGIITGTCVKVFTLAGPVIVFGMVSSVIYGIIFWAMQMF